LAKILAVDDSVTMRRILEMTFIGQDGIQVVSTDGHDAGAANGADLLIVDVAIGSTSGYDFVKAVRGNGVGAPILMMGSEHHPIDQERLRASGADDSMNKPFETQALIDKAKDLIARGGKGVAAPAAAPRPVAVAAPAPAAPRPPAPPAAAPARPAPAAPIPGVVAAPPRPAAPAPAPAAPAAAPAAAQVRSATASFGAPAGSKPPSAQSTPAAVSAPRPAPAAQAVPLVNKKQPEHDAVAAASAEMEGKLSGMGLTPAQVEGVLALSREVIERVVWEVVPDLAETIIREEIKRLTS
jgi:CheY-like chemotaxis protein